MALIFLNEEEKVVTANGEPYKSMLTDLFIPQIEDMDQADIHFQQDAATCHNTRENMSILRDHFPGRLISWFGDVDWPARSPNLSPLHFFFWVRLKEKF